MSVGWAILGTGGFPDEKVAPALNLVDGGELIAVMSRDAARAAEFGAKHGAQVGYDSIEAVLADTRVDAVYIANRNHLHAPHAILALKAGKHVFMEKPIALNFADGVEVVKASESSACKLGVGFELRQHPGRIESKELISAGALGTVALAQAQFGSGVRGNINPKPRSGHSDRLC